MSQTTFIISLCIILAIVIASAILNWKDLKRQIASYNKTKQFTDKYEEIKKSYNEDLEEYKKIKEKYERKK